MVRSASGKKPVFIRFLLLALNLLILLFLFAAYAAYHISPSKLPLLAFAGIAYPYSLAANIIMIFIWLAIYPRYALISMIPIILGWNHINRLIQVIPANDLEKTENNIKILSYNIQNFIKLNLSSTNSIKNFENERNIKSFLKSEKADIYCIQEFLNDYPDKEAYIREFGKMLDCKYIYYRNYYASNKRIIDALAIFSSFPILNQGFLEHESKTIGIYTDLIRNKDTVRIYNLHLASIHFKKEDYDFWSGFNLDRDKNDIQKGTKNIYSKLKLAYIKRSKQSELISRHIEASEYPVIICGDFNDTPSSYSYNVLSSGRIDAFVKKGSGFGTTYAGKFFPAFRIDYILHDPYFKTAGFQMRKIQLSDHFPLSAEIIINKD